MKNLLICLLFFGLISGLISCGDFTKFTYTKTKSIPINYFLNINGNFNEEGIINEYDIKKSFDLPEFSKIEKVVINGVNMNIEMLPETDASTLDLEGKMIIRTQTGNEINYDMIKSESYSLIGVTFFDLNKVLNGGGIKAVKDFLQQAVDPLSNTGNTSARIVLKGFAHSLLGEPEKIKANLSVNINATITFSRCEHVEINIWGDDCD
jgi:hypothetical protein